MKIANVIKIKDASFDGTIVKEICLESSCSSDETSDDRVLLQLKYLSLHNESNSDDSRIIKRQHPICYYVMSFARYGELYRLIEMNERLSDNLIRYLFIQLLQGLNKLHQSGFVHRDIKPENLLINKNFKLVIADFNFAARLDRTTSNSFTP